METIMKPGEIITKSEEIILNEGSQAITLKVSNTGDRPITVGSHYHFYETNEFLSFDWENSKVKRLNIPSGTEVRFEPGQTWEVELIDFKGKREIFGFNQKIMGALWWVQKFLGHHIAKCMVQLLATKLD